jgi:AraC family transcriptional regulator
MRNGELRVDGRDPIRQTDLRRKITYLPAGVPVAGWTDPLERPNSFVAIHFDVAAIPEPLRERSAFDEPSVYFQNRGLCETLSKLERVMARNEPLVELLAESLCDLAIIEFGLSQTASAVSDRPSPTLSPQQVSDVYEYIAANLATSVSLSELAAVVGLSKFHFSRAFKSATGRSPYQEVLRRRLAVARSLLGDGRGMAEAAAATGFTSAAQLARSLRQHPSDDAGARWRS